MNIFRCLDRTKIFDIIVLLVIGILMRVAYITYYPCMQANGDSYGYEDIGRHILAVPSVKTIINPFRPPLYPVFLNVAKKTADSTVEPMNMPDCQPGARNVGFLQTAANLFGMVVFYVLARWLLNHRVAALAVSIVQITTINLIAFERSLVSESFSIPLGIILAAAAVYALRSPTWKRLCLVSLLSIVGILLRPIFILYPLIIFLFIACWHKSLFVGVRSLVVLSPIIIFLFWVSYMNSVNYGYYGINHVSEISHMSLIMQYHLPLDSVRDQPLTQQIIAYQKTRPTDPNVFLFINAYNIDIFSADTLKQMRNFDATVIAHSPAAFLGHTIGNIPRSFLYKDEFFVPRPQGSMIPMISYYVFLISQYIDMVSIPFIFIAWVRLVGKITIREAGAALVGTIAYGQILLVAICGDNITYVRFYTPIYSILFLFVAFWVMRLFQLVAKKGHTVAQ
jgi:hypothetical protein